MQEKIFGIASFLIAAFAFGFGVFKLFRKKKPLYLQILICAAGCFAIQQLSYIINVFCGVGDKWSIGALGIFGCNFFLLSANFGTLDKIVDDGKESKFARRLALIAPVLTAALSVIAFLSRKRINTFCGVMWLIMLIPTIPASYYNLKHILLPLDPFEFLRATKPCNIITLAFYAMTFAYVICSAVTPGWICGMLSVLMSLTMLCLSISAVKGAKKWGI